MSQARSNPISWRPGRVFYIGLAIVLLANALPLIPNWYTFVHPWRVEIASSIFLASLFIYVLINFEKLQLRFQIDRDEFRFVILPLLAFILWSFLSGIWAPFWKSSIHHSLIWTEYLAFYLVFRYAASEWKIENNLLILFAGTLVLYAVPAIVEYFAFISFGGPTTLGMRYAKYGEQVVTILPLLLLAVVRMRGRQFAFGAAAACLLWLLIFCSFGRINYFLFGCVLAVVGIALLASQRHRQYLPKFALLVLVFILASLPLQISSLFSSNVSASPASRFSDSEGLSDSNNFRKLMISVSREMIREHPIVGIGADNFGFEVNRYRARYGAANPADVNLAAAEDQNPEHAHNEFLQITAELGVVGLAIFTWILVGIALIAIRSLRELRSGSLVGFASVTGVGMYLVSSLVSAYSFRVMQNGILFFFVLAVAVSSTRNREKSDEKAVDLPLVWFRPAMVAVLLASIGLTTYSGLRIASVAVANRANITRSLESSRPLYELAMKLDDENPDVRQSLGMRLFRSRRYIDAIPQLESAMSIGRGASADFSYLATSYSLGGDDVGAERTMSTAVALYPRSPFVLTRYAAVLEKNGRAAEADELFARASEINSKAARTWQALINSGAKNLSELAARDSASYSQVMDLKPQSSIYAVVTERLIRYPEEQRFSFAKLPEEEQ